MTGVDLRDLINDAVPALKSPPDRIEAVGRQVRRQRVSVAVSTAIGITTLALAVGVVSGLRAKADPISGLHFAAPGTASATADPTPTSVEDGMPTEDPKVAKARLDAALDAALARVAPDANVTKPLPVLHVDAPEVDAFGYELGRLVTVQGRQGTLIVTIQIPQENYINTCAENVAPGYVAVCEDQVGPHGEQMMVMPATGDAGIHAALVRIILRDGTMLTVTNNNGAALEVPGGVDARGEETNFGMESREHMGELPSLTIEQVIAIATDPAITMYP